MAKPFGMMKKNSRENVDFRPTVFSYIMFKGRPGEHRGPSRQHRGTPAITFHAFNFLSELGLELEPELELLLELELELGLGLELELP